MAVQGGFGRETDAVVTRWLSPFACMRKKRRERDMRLITSSGTVVVKVEVEVEVEVSK